MSSLLAPSPNDVVILADARTPQGKLLGQLAPFTPVELDAHAVKHAVRRSGVAPEEVQHVALGQMILAGAGQNPARQVAIKAGLPRNMTTEIVSKVCLSDLNAVIYATRLIRPGNADVVVAGGQEFMTHAPHVACGVRQGKSLGTPKLEDTLERDGLVDSFDGVSMGTFTDGSNNDLGISREQQDEVTAAFHQRAAKAQEDGIFAQETALIEIPQCKGDPVVVDTDQGIHSETTVETLTKLHPVFLKENGTIITGNSSPISDGTAAAVLASRAYVEKRDLDHLAVVGETGQTAGPDNSLHAQPADSLKEALCRTEWDAQELDFIEINEALGTVAVKSLRELDYPLEKINIHGGAIVLGHPTGCSGARLTLIAIMGLNRRGSGRTGVSLCGGGGQGDALLLYRD